MGDNTMSNEQTSALRCEAAARQSVGENALDGSPSQRHVNRARRIKDQRGSKVGQRQSSEEVQTKFCTWMIDVLVGMALAIGGVGIVVDHYWCGQ